MFKHVVFIGYNREGPYIDMKYVVPWPDITHEAMQATFELSGRPGLAVLEEMGYPEAVAMVKDMTAMRIRAQSQVDFEEFVFDADVRLTDEEILVRCIVEGYPDPSSEAAAEVNQFTNLENEP